MIWVSRMSDLKNCRSMQLYMRLIKTSICSFIHLRSKQNKQYTEVLKSHNTLESDVVHSGAISNELGA